LNHCPTVHEPKNSIRLVVELHLVKHTHIQSYTTGGVQAQRKSDKTEDCAEKSFSAVGVAVESMANALGQTGALSVSFPWD
jgi:hypothetical protein